MLSCDKPQNHYKRTIVILIHAAESVREKYIKSPKKKSLHVNVDEI